MGIFKKIQNILFEDDGEEDLPVYEDKEEKSVKNEAVEEKTRRTPAPMVETPTPQEPHFKTPKAEIDYGDDILDEVGNTNNRAEMEMPKMAQREPEPVPKETRSPFLSFDAEEFDRLNSHVVSNEKQQKTEKISKEEPKREEIRKMDYSEFQRKANNNVSATNPTRDMSRTNPDRYKIEETTGKKPFKPSPVISPVYGILDKNYKVDDIVDKKDGIRREVYKPPVREEIVREPEIIEEEPEEDVVVNIDSVRNKAFGAMDDLNKDIVKKVEIEEEEIDEPLEIPIIADDEDEEDFVVSNEVSDVEGSLDDLVSEHFDNIEEKEEEENFDEVPREMDEMEKTSTLQILDDIEKELNSIKPATKSNASGDDDLEEQNSESLENDLFNLIDSMYEDGEEDIND